MVARGGRRTLAADDLDGSALAGVVDNDRHIAAGAVEMRLDHLQRERGGDRGIEGVAALLQDSHAHGGGDPMGRRDDAESALDLGPGGEGIWVDIGCHVSGRVGSRAVLVLRSLMP